MLTLSVQCWIIHQTAPKNQQAMLGNSYLVVNPVQQILWCYLRLDKTKPRPQLFLGLSVLSQTDGLPRLTCFEKTPITFFTTTLSATTTTKTASNYCTFIVIEWAKYQLFFNYTICIAWKKSISTWRPLSWSGCNLDERGKNNNINVHEWKLTVLVAGNIFCPSNNWKTELWPGFCFIQSYLVNLVKDTTVVD